MIFFDQLNEFRPNVGVVLFNGTGDVFYGQRVQNNLADDDPSFRWQFPQGGVDEGENIISAARRELAEETGIRSAHLLALTPGWLAYEFPADYRRRKWRGQRQKWAAMLFNGDPTEIDLCADDEQEFDDWRWGPLEEAPSLIVPFKRGVYEEIVEAFLPLRNYLREQSDR